MLKQAFSPDSPYKKTAFRLAVFWTLIIFLLCFLPGEDIPDVQIPFVDKWVHLILFGAFSFLWLCAYPSGTRKSYFLALVASIFLGWLVEVIQGQLTFLHRSQDNLDTLADSVGGLLGVVLFGLLTALFSKKKT